MSDSAAGLPSWLWNSTDATDTIVITFDYPDTPLYLDSLTPLDWDYFILPTKTVKPPPETGWGKFHEKVKHESLRRHTQKRTKYRRVPAVRGHRWR